MRRFTVLAQASLLVTVEAPDEEAARERYQAIQDECFDIDFTTRDDHHLGDLELKDHIELYQVDGEEPVKGCEELGCEGYVINDACTSGACPALAGDRDNGSSHS